MNKIKQSIDRVMLLSLGFGVGVCATYVDRLVHVQDGFTEGRQSVLNSTVIVGGRPSRCAVEIPLSSLADMVNIGIIDWYEHCAKEPE